MHFYSIRYTTLYVFVPLGGSCQNVVSSHRASQSTPLSASMMVDVNSFCSYSGCRAVEQIRCVLDWWVCFTYVSFQEPWNVFPLSRHIDSHLVCQVGFSLQCECCSSFCCFIISPNLLILVLKPLRLYRSQIKWFPLTLTVCRCTQISVHFLLFTHCAMLWCNSCKGEQTVHSFDSAGIITLPLLWVWQSLRLAFVCFARPFPKSRCSKVPF